MQSSLADLQQQCTLLQKEYDYEKEFYRQQTEQAGIYRRIRQGACWYPVTPAASRYNSLNQLTVEIQRTESDDTEHAFEHGRPVCFFTTTTSGALRYLPFTATVSYVRDDRMIVTLPTAAALATLTAAGTLGVQLHFDDSTYKAMFAALHEVIAARDNRTAHLREVLLGTTPATTRELPPLRFPWLNPSQEEAVNRVLTAREVAVVHGPPGTGKTTTLVEAIYETLQRENQVLVCAQSNTAVDWIAEKLTDRGIPVLRIGNPTRVNDKMLAFTYERRFEAHSDYPELWNLRKAIREATTRLHKSKHTERNTLHNQLAHLRPRATEIEIRINAQLFAEARVIACTLAATTSRTLERRRFSSLFIDEAAQAIEAACWMGILRADRVILAGDHCQLPPTIKCPEAAHGGLDHTLLQKVAHNKPAAISLLSIQYRMHEDIMRFPSHWFYNNQLQAAPEVRHRGILQFDTPITWIDTAGLELTEQSTREGSGRLNTGEAALLISQLKTYMLKIGETRIIDETIDFGLISPYRAQVQHLRTLVRKDPFFRPFRSLITVHTVDGFQGQERDVIFISLVRANDDGQIGFLRDLRRMNVAITRARMKLLILGDASTLTRHPFYKALHEYTTNLGKS